MIIRIRIDPYSFDVKESQGLQKTREWLRNT